MATALDPIGDLDGWTRDRLEAEIRRHNRLYWEEQAPEISDYDFDRLVLRLKAVAPDSPALEELGERRDTLGAPVTHASPMLSLDKCYGELDLDDWASKLEGDFLVMPKFDGIACSLRYGAGGRLEVAATRGTGFVGDDVTVNARSLRDIPAKVSRPDIEVRGEVYMRLSVFAGFRDRFSNPRNLTAGAMKQKDTAKSAGYNLSFAAYDLLGTDLPTEREKLEWLKSEGFSPPDVLFARHGELQRAYEAFAARRPTLDYEIDGVVFRANLVREQRRLGLTSHHPRYALAYKFQGESGRTKLNDVEWSVSRTGAITPVALIEPVQLSGASVSRASLHHAGYVKTLGLAHGCEVLVTRRGGVIPHVEKVITPGTEPFVPPEKCPSCGAPTRFGDDFLFCTDVPHCRVAQVGELVHWCAVTDLLGFGEKLLAAGYDRGLLRTPVDLYTVTPEQLLELDRIGEKTAQKLVQQVNARRELPLATFLRALGAPELGSHVSGLLAQNVGNLKRIRELTVEELGEMHSVGEVIARSVVQGLRERADLIDGLLRHVKVVPPLETTADGPLEGLSFVFTGKLESMDRKVAQAEVRRLGADTPAGVTASLSYLVIGVEKDGEKSSKQKSAEKHNTKGAGIRIVDEAQFLALLEAAKAGRPPA